MLPPPPRPTLFPYTTLFRSHAPLGVAMQRGHDDRVELGRARRVVIRGRRDGGLANAAHRLVVGARGEQRDRKSTRLNSSHSSISYAVFCLKKKKKKKQKIII